MSVRIQLDAGALAALFPEGSEARADLSRAVVANLIQKLAVKDVYQLDDRLRADVNKHVKEAMTSLGLGKDHWGNVQLDPRVKDKITLHIKDRAENVITSEVARAIQEGKAEIDGRVQERIEEAINTSVSSRLRELIRNEVKGMFK